MLNFLLELVSGMFNSVGYSATLDTKKIDQNIVRLNQHEWFKEIYEDEKYHRMFFANKHIRRYLQSSYRVRKMISHEKDQRKFLLFIHKQLNRS
jgi:hypothetical protein